LGAGLSFSRLATKAKAFISVSWRTTVDFLKRREWPLQVADKLGRGRGTMRWLDEYNLPPAAKKRPDLSRFQNVDLAAAWIGHATVLLRVQEMTILTDPVFANRVGLGMWLGTLGPKRQIAAALTPQQLPPLDLILISHAHFDHLDRQSLARLNKKTPVITAFSTSDLIRDLGFRNITELRWGEQTRVDGLSFTAREVVHWGARTFIDQQRGYNAYLIQGSRKNVLYGGDSAYQEHFKDIDRVDLAILGIGAYDPYIRAHATPEQALAMADHARAERILPMHHSTFRLSHEPMGEPIERIVTAAGKAADRIVIKEVGETWVDG
jgi:L-ascorbate metabolism protein UlaG (beta-lactamase superfamily)